MRFFIMGHGLRGAGAVSVGRNLLPEMISAGSGHHHFIITIPRDRGFMEVLSPFSNVTTITPGPDISSPGLAGLARRWRWENHTLPRLVRESAAHVLLGMADRALLHPPCPQAVLVHRSQLFYPERHYRMDSLKNRLLFRYHAHHLRRSLPAVDLLLCQTRTARERLRAHYRYHGPCAIVPNAVSALVRPPRPGNGGVAGGQHKILPSGAEAPGDGAVRLLCLGRYYAHKNLEAVLQLYRRYPDQLAGCQFILTIDGCEHPRALRLLQDISRHRLQDRIINMGPAPQQELTGLFESCHALFFPTFLESFSATYLEAMAHDLPIITSDLDFAHDICGEKAAEYIDPWDHRSMLEGISRVVRSRRRRTELITEGRRRLDELEIPGWNRIAANVLGELEKLGASRPHAPPVQPPQRRREHRD